MTEATEKERGVATEANVFNCKTKKWPGAFSLCCAAGWPYSLPGDEPAAPSHSRSSREHCRRDRGRGRGRAAGAGEVPPAPGRTGWENFLLLLLRGPTPTQLSPGRTKPSMGNHLESQLTLFFIVTLQLRDLSHFQMTEWFVCKKHKPTSTH